MTAAIALIAVGFMMLVSAFKGISILDVLRGEEGDKLDPKGGAPAGVGLNTGGLPGGLPVPGGAASGTSFKGPKADLLAHLATVARNNFHLTITDVCRSPDAGYGSSTSLHHSCRAFDASGAAADMTAFFDYVEQNHRNQVQELFYDPRGAIKRGFTIPAIGGHDDHVHVGA